MTNTPDLLSETLLVVRHVPPQLDRSLFCDDARHLGVDRDILEVVRGVKDQRTPEEDREGQSDRRPWIAHTRRT